jgi:hypothetical protein
MASLRNGTERSKPPLSVRGELAVSAIRSQSARAIRQDEIARVTEINKLSKNDRYRARTRDRPDYT